jgi:hypothetical protein
VPRLSTVNRLQAAVRVERIETLLERQTARLKRAEAQGWPCAELQRSLENLMETRRMYLRHLGLGDAPVAPGSEKAKS